MAEAMFDKLIGYGVHTWPRGHPGQCPRIAAGLPRGVAWDYTPWGNEEHGRT